MEFVAAVAYTCVGGALTSCTLTARTRRRFDRLTGVTMIGMAGAPAGARE